MSYAKSIFFIPVWFDQLQSFTSALEGTSLWEATDSKKVWAGYLFRYASDINRKKECNITINTEYHDLIEIRPSMYGDDKDE